MANSEGYNITELAEALRSHVERRAHSNVSSESIADVANILTELAATLREDLNSRTPLFQLPVEILQKILDQVPNPLSKSHNEFRPPWHSSAMDTSMLTPILQTCRRLRRIALSHISLWQTISLTPEYALPSILLQRSCDIPLIAVIDGSSGGKVWDNLDKVDGHRMQELHLFDIGLYRIRDDIIAGIRQYFEAGFPLLEFLSISHLFLEDEEEEDNIDTDKCPFPLHNVPRLRHMALQDVTFIPTNDFPHLTHLALSNIDNSDYHIETAYLLSRCPNLESLSICYLHSPDLPLELPDGFPHPLALKRLSRVTLQLPQFCDDVTAFYLSFVPQDDAAPQPIALQILELTIIDDVSQLGQTLFRITKGEASHLSLSLQPHLTNDLRKSLVISAVGPKGTFHASTEWLRGVDFESTVDPGESMEAFLDSILCHCAHLRAVREVWVTGVPPLAGGLPFCNAASHFKSIIAALPALQTIVLVVTTVGPQLEVDLGLCPSAHDPGFASPHFKTLRIVYGTDKYTGRGPVEKTKLTNLLHQIGTGEYGYFENVILEMTQRLTVDGKDFARLRARVKNVTVRHIHSMPTMPLPEYCTEPYAGPGGSSTWHGSLW